ncbi:MAG: FGGY-family carbohydrate kinase, partial [Synergistaceae bacterium]|nr:FGGY-family carbohydrate kinase [Synergistaceae bacterium]
VSSGHGDSEVSCCGAGVVESGSMIMAMGTSTCHQMLYGSYHGFDGVCAIAGDGMVPGLYSYESGQPAVGDIFEWYAEKCVPASYREEADNRGIAILDLLNEKASVLEAGRSGLIALDWFNGNRSTLANYNLTGLILGLTLETKPEEVYRCLVEATQFGSRKIIENYEKNGLRVEHLFATGGLAEKSAFVMQICADILGREVIVPLFDDVPARGAAICAAVAAGPDNGGAAGFAEAVAKLTPKDRALYAPNPANREIYDELYTFYEKLYELFGADGSFMSRLKSVGNGKTPEIFGKNVKESAL